MSLSSSLLAKPFIMPRIICSRSFIVMGLSLNGVDGEVWWWSPSLGWGFGVSVPVEGAKPRPRLPARGGPGHVSHIYLEAQGMEGGLRAGLRRNAADQPPR